MQLCAKHRQRSTTLSPFHQHLKIKVFLSRWKACCTAVSWSCVCPPEVGCLVGYLINVCKASTTSSCLILRPKIWYGNVTKYLWQRVCDTRVNPVIIWLTRKVWDKNTVHLILLTDSTFTPDFALVSMNFTPCSSASYRNRVRHTGSTHQWRFRDSYASVTFQSSHVIFNQACNGSHDQTECHSV